jgi:hypothetical protein
MPKENQAPINKLCKHQFEECSDLPRLTRIGIFSCSACDIWRERVHSKGHRSLPRRDFLSDRHQCRRPKLNMGPIKIRVIYNPSGPTLKNPSVPEALQVDQENTTPNIPKRPTREELGKRKRAKVVLHRLEKAREAKQVEAQLILNREYAKVEKELEV